MSFHKSELTNEEMMVHLTLQSHDWFVIDPYSHHLSSIPKRVCRVCKQVEEEWKGNWTIDGGPNMTRMCIEVLFLEEGI